MAATEVNKGYYYHHLYVPLRLESAWKAMSVYVPRWGQLAQCLPFDSQKYRAD
ncbi:hypothetical protein CDV31_003520 [Fusarium ambrosium]|uniref:Uncharacterized protein n=1 Tax=Fusarium ambrosium TaxID=131363 RepID=A0A428UTI5_9HYPO|nr:hypothetical protein CDV31_003520 [Fusarium ambrosium]